MIESLRASSLAFKGAEAPSPRDSYVQLIQDNDAKAQQASLNRPTPPEGQGKNLDVIA